MAGDELDDGADLARARRVAGEIHFAARAQLDELDVVPPGLALGVTPAAEEEVELERGIAAGGEFTADLRPVVVPLERLGEAILLELVEVEEGALGNRRA